MGTQRVDISGVPVWNTGFYSHKNLLTHSPDFLIFSCLQQTNFILQVVSGSGQICAFVCGGVKRRSDMNWQSN